MFVINTYIENVINYDLVNKFKYNSIKNIPKIQKIYLNFNCKTTLLKFLLSSLVALELISLQKSIFTYTKTSNILFKVKKGSPVGCTVVLRKNNMEWFLTELLTNIFPKLESTNKLNIKKCHIFSFKIKNPLIFQELEKRYQFFNNLTNLNITIVTNSQTKNELKFLLHAFKII